MRRPVQIVLLLLFSILFFCNRHSESLPVPADIFLKIDPLLALANTLASRQLDINIVAAALVLLATLLAGRFFCGYVCPLGTLFDCTAKGKKLPAPHPLKNIKYYILAAVAATSILGLNTAAWIDPISFLTRVYTVVLYPLAAFGGNLGLDAARPAAESLGLVALSHAWFKQPLFYGIILTVGLAAGLFWLNAVSPRFWCRNLCPLGGLLSAISRISLFRRHVSSACNRCMQCRTGCPMGAIASDPDTTDQGECVVCTNCRKVCPRSAVFFRLRDTLSRGRQPPLSLTKRSMLASAGTASLAVFTMRFEATSRIHRGTVIRPPGAVPENLFLTLCVRCGQCMKVCPTNTLQPCLLESGMEGLWSPRLLPRLAGCDQTCRLCGSVCPTGALRRLPIEEKKHAKLGTAHIDRDRCLVWAQDRLCLICDEQCPYNAIVFKWDGGQRRPYIIDTKCNGCGFCEEQCPVTGQAAIIVTPQNQIRLARGSYRRKASELQLQFTEDPGDDGYFSPGEQLPGKQQDTGVPQGFSPK